MTEGRVLAHDWFPRPLPANVHVGDRSWLYSAFAFLHYQSQRPCGVRIGSDTGVYNGSFFELGPTGEVEVGDFCTLVGVIINTNQRVVIHDYALISHEVILADCPTAVPPSRVSGEQQVDIGVSIVVGENAWIGARAILLSGARIGKNSVVGAAAIVDFDVPANSIVAGNPARIVGSVGVSRPKEA